MNNVSFIEPDHLSKSFINDGVATPVLHDISLTIGQGEFVAIMGPSGSGKSTLMHVLGFLDTPSSGVYRFKDKDVSSLTDTDLASMRLNEIGFVFQSFNLLARTSVLENVALPMMYARVPFSQRRQRALESLKTVHLEHRLEHLSNQLSGGERQRVAIARALVNHPSLLLADEPTGNLDTKTGIEVLTMFQELHAQGKTVVMITHDAEAAKFAQRTISIRDGRLMDVCS